MFKHCFVDVLFAHTCTRAHDNTLLCAHTHILYANLWYDDVHEFERAQTRSLRLSAFAWKTNNQVCIHLSWNAADWMADGPWDCRAIQMKPTELLIAGILRILEHAFKPQRSDIQNLKLGKIVGTMNTQSKPFIKRIKPTTSSSLVSFSV